MAPCLMALFLDMSCSKEVMSASVSESAVAMTFCSLMVRGIRIGSFLAIPPV